MNHERENCESGKHNGIEPWGTGAAEGSSKGGH